MKPAWRTAACLATLLLAACGPQEPIRIGFIGDALDTLLMEDSFGQITRFSFLDTKRNPKLDPKLFKLDRPIGGDFLEIN